MKSKKGFTLTEIIAALVILGVVVAIAIPGVNVLQDKFKKNYYEKLDDTIVSAAKTYFKDNAENKPNGAVGAVAISYNTLTSGKYLDISAYNNNEECTGYVSIYKLNEKYTYDNCMICETKGSRNEVYKSSDFNKSNTSCNFYDRADKSEIESIGKATAITKSSFDESSSSVYYYVDENTDISNPNFWKIQEKVRIGKNEELKVTGNEIYPENITSIPMQSINLNTNEFKHIKLTYIANIDNDEGKVTKDVYLYKYFAPNVSGIVSGEIRSESIQISPSTIKFDGVAYPNGDTFAPTGTATFVKYEYSTDGGANWTNNHFTTPDANKPFNESFDASSLNGKDIKFRMVVDDNGTKKYIETVAYKVNISYTITFVANGGTWTTSTCSTSNGFELDSTKTKCSYKTYTNKVDKFPGDPSYTGYTYGGKWYTADSNGSEVQLGTSINGNVTYYAHWTLENYTITLNVNGGTAWTSSTCSGTNLTFNSSDSSCKMTVRYQGKSSNYPVATRSGYIFVGWFTTSTYKTSPLYFYRDTYTDLKNAFGSDQYKLYEHYLNYGINEGRVISEYRKDQTYTNQGNMTVYAGWLAQKAVTVTFDANGGTASPTSKTVMFGAPYGDLAEVDRDNYFHSGWFTAKTDGNKVTKTSIVKTASNHTLYAHWEQDNDDYVPPCVTQTLNGVYWIEIVGGGGASKGIKGDGGGHNAARWAGYMYFPNGTYSICPGAGGTKILKGNGGAELGINTAGAAISLICKLFGKNCPEWEYVDFVNDGGDSYIQNSSGTNIVTAMGGKIHGETATDSVVTFSSASTNKLMECEYQKGTECGNGIMRYGRGCKYSRRVYSFGNGSSGAPGTIQYERIASLSEWNSNSKLKVCRSEPICTTAECAWLRADWQ